MNIYERVLKIHGATHQKVKAIEELGELIVALAKELNGIGSHESVIEEIADVENMIAQLRILFNSKQIDDIRTHKLKRLESRLDNAEEDFEEHG
jgi:NTP pyrophosphatase (non-canonical NTP hydrolase)